MGQGRLEGEEMEGRAKQFGEEEKREKEGGRESTKLVEAHKSTQKFLMKCHTHFVHSHVWYYEHAYLES